MFERSREHTIETMKVDILGVRIDDINMAEALATVEKWIWNPGPDGSFHRGSRTNEIRRDKHYIVTPNPEILVAAQKDPIFKDVLNDADLSIPDGAGLKLSGRVKNTFSGTDFMEKLISLAAEKGFTTAFLGGKTEVAEKTAECLKKKYPKLKVVFAESGGDIDDQGNILRPSEANGEATNKTIIVSKVGSRLRSNNNIPPLDILFVAFGHIKQEKWIARNLEKIPAHVTMGVGGAFDYLSGSVPRAPKWIRDLGFEWLFRLVIQPWRIKRQLALIQYLWLLIKG